MCCSGVEERKVDGKGRREDVLIELVCGLISCEIFGVTTGCEFINLEVYLIGCGC